MSLLPLSIITVPCLVGELELADQDPRFSASSTEAGGYRHAVILVRLHGQPIAVLGSDAASTEGDAAQLRADAESSLYAAICDHLEKDGLADLTSWSADKEPACRTEYCRSTQEPALVSVIVCTRNNPAELRRAIASVLALDYRSFELLVVDNAPADHQTRNIVRDMMRLDPRVRYVLEEVGGLSLARNRGVRAARGEYVAFTDDDAVVDREWLGRIVATFRSRPGIECVTGLVLPAELQTNAQLWYEQFGGFPKSLQPQLFDLGANRPSERFFPMSAIFGSGNNMAFRRTTLEKLGGFDVALGAGTPCGGEDGDAFFRTIMAGHTLAYEPSAIVWHTHQRDLGELCRQVSASPVTGLLTKFLVANPSELLPFALKVPPALAAYLFGPRGKYRQESAPVPFSLRLADVRGLASGPFLYGISKARQRFSRSKAAWFRS